MRRRLTRTLIASLAVSSLIVTPVFAEPDSSGLETKKEATQSEVSSLQSQLTKIMVEMDELESKMIEKGENIIQANSDLEIAQVKEKEQYEAMKLRIKYMYESGDNAAMEKIFTSGSISDLLNSAEYMKSVHSYDRKKLQEYVDTQNQIADLKSTLEKDMNKMETLKSDFSTQQASLGTTISSKQAEVADLDSQIQAAAAAAAQERQKDLASQTNQVVADTAGGITGNTGNSNTGNSNAGGTTTTPPSNNNNTGGGTVTPPSNNTGGTTPTTPPSNGTNTGGATKPPASTGDTSKASTIVSTAYSYIGTPYVYGGSSYSGIDCSGLTMRCHQAAGISISRTSGAQAGGGKNVGSLANALPGDIICYPGHVAVYIGNSTVIHAPTEGQNVKVASVYMGASQPISAIRRYW